jgi:methanogenic corrinoid protein MtbC1
MISLTDVREALPIIEAFMGIPSLQLKSLGHNIVGEDVVRRHRDRVIEIACRLVVGPALQTTVIDGTQVKIEVMEKAGDRG